MCQAASDLAIEKRAEFDLLLLLTQIPFMILLQTPLDDSSDEIFFLPVNLEVQYAHEIAF